MYMYMDKFYILLCVACYFKVAQTVTVLSKNCTIYSVQGLNLQNCVSEHEKQQYCIAVTCRDPHLQSSRRPR